MFVNHHICGMSLCRLLDDLVKDEVGASEEPDVKVVNILTLNMYLMGTILECWF